METLAGTSAFRHMTIRVGTQDPTQFIDITDQLEAIVVAAAIETGLVNVQTLHTTTAIVVNEPRFWSARRRGRPSTVTTTSPSAR